MNSELTEQENYNTKWEKMGKIAEFTQKNTVNHKHSPVRTELL